MSPRFFNKLAITAIILILVGWLIKLGLNKLEEGRLEKIEREKKQASGMCVYNKVDLDNFVVLRWEKSFNPILKVEDFKRYFHDELLKINLNDTALGVETIRLDNNDLSFYKEGEDIFVSSIKFDNTSQFSFQIKNKLNLTPEYSVENFKEQFPESYSCREDVSRSSKIEQFAVILENSNVSSKLHSIALYFNRVDELMIVEFYYNE